MKGKLFAIYAVLWLMMIGVTLYQQVGDVRNYAKSIAYKQAEMLFRHLVVARQWNAGHGGVYVRTQGAGTDSAGAERQNTDSDLILSGGERLMAIDPTEMIRQLAAMEQGQSGIRFHFAGMDPAVAEFKADSWEQAGLNAFKRGERLHADLTEIDAQPYYRYMAPLFVEEPCVDCRNSQGMAVGGLLGGISIGIPASSVDGFISARLINLAFTHALIAAVGLITLLLSYLAQAKLSKRLDKTKSHLQLAYLDSLTLLPNRRYYDAFVRREWKRACRHHYPLSMIMIDIDYFKPYNDNLGHVEGDQCLRQVARTLKRYFRRPGDLIARYGGEEFCVVAACDSDQIFQLANILRTAVETMQLPHPESKISKYVTISLGVATLIPSEKLDWGQLLLNADQALYAAKQVGRNCVQKYSA